MKKIRVVIDTNIWVSLLLTKQVLFAENLLKNPKLWILACQILYTEIGQVLRRSKFKKYITEQDITGFEIIFQERAFEINLQTNTKGASRDAKDDFLLALAQDGQAEYLVTGDKDLLVLENFAQTQIISLRYFTDHILPYI